MRILILTPNLSLNSLGRAYCLWLLARGLGWQVEVVSILGERIWAPLSGSVFEMDCRLSTSEDLAAQLAVCLPDLLIAVKPLPSSFGVALTLRKRFDLPLMLDIDDPDLESQLSWHNPIKRVAKSVFRRRYIRQLIFLRKATKTVPKLVSNPELQKLYGGTIIPHVRHDIGAGAAHSSKCPLVAFVGTVGKHKGVRELRKAVAQLEARGVRLLITSEPPADAKPWEQWVGITDWVEGRRIVANADIVVIPSRRGVVPNFQLPAKLMDAMMAGRGVAVSNVGPLPWALGHGGIVFKPSSVTAIRDAIESLLDPKMRMVLGTKARIRVLEFGTVSGNIPTFAVAVREALATNTR